MRPLFDADAAYLCAVLAVALLLWVPRFYGPIDLRFDAGVYYILGTSLAEGRGYRLLNEPGEIQAIQYPPLLPALVAVHQWALGNSDPMWAGHALRLSFFALFTAYGGAAYVMARRYLAPNYAFFAAWSSLVYLLSFYLSDFLFAELPFALATVLFVICSRAGPGRLPAALAGLFAIAAYLLRTTGIALLAAWVAESFLRRRWRQGTTRTLISLLPILLWQAYVAGVRSGPEYAHPAYLYQRAPYQYYNVSYVENLLLVDAFVPELGVASPEDLTRRMRDMATVTLLGLGESLTAPIFWWRWLVNGHPSGLGRYDLPEWPVLVPLLSLVSLVVAGLGLLVRRREWLIPIYVAATLGLVCLTPWPAQVPRYLMPMTPFLASACLLSLAASETCCARVWPRPWSMVGRLFTVMIVTIILAVQSFTLVDAYRDWLQPVRTYDARGHEVVYHLFGYDGRDGSWSALDAALQWVERDAATGDVIVTTAPHLAYLRTGLKAVLPPLEPNTEQAQALLDSVPAKYVIVDDLTFLDISRRYAQPVIRAHPELWALVYSSPDGAARVYRRADWGAARGAARSRAPRACGRDTCVDPSPVDILAGQVRRGLPHA